MPALSAMASGDASGVEPSGYSSNEGGAVDTAGHQAGHQVPPLCGFRDGEAATGGGRGG